MKFGVNQIVELRNGLYGVVASFNDKPFQLVFKSYTNPISRYDNQLRNKNSSYDVIRVYDGSELENVTDVFSKKFDVNKYKLIWEGNND